MFQVTWVEIPVKDIERAGKFYQTVFGLAAKEVYNGDVRRTLNLFYDETMAKPGISLNQTASFEPSEPGKGLFIYFDCGEDLTPTLNRVEAAGGKIIMGKTSLGSDGFYAPILDTEGNSIGLYSTQ